MDNSTEVNQTNNFLSKIKTKLDITKLQIHVLLDYNDFYTKFTDPNNSETVINGLIEQYTVQEPKIPIYMFNFSFRNDTNSTPPTLLLERNITFADLTKIIQELNKKLLNGGSRKTKRSLAKNKKHKTEKKKNCTSEH